MISRIIRIIIREHRTLHQLEMVDGIHNGGVDAALVGAFVQYPAVVVLFQWCLLKKGTQHIFVLHLAHAQDAQGTVLRHGQDGLVHVVALLVEPRLGPMLHSFFGEGIVGLSAVHKGVEEILHVPEGDADSVVLCKNRISNHKTRKT